MNMGQQQRVYRSKSERNSDTETIEEDASPPETKDAQALKDELDDILDEIDTVLEENAAQFVKEYIQKGGQ